VGDPVEGVDAAAEFVAVGRGDDVVGAGFEGEFGEGVFVGRVAGDEELAGVEKLKHHGAGSGEVATVTGEDGAEVFGGADLVVGRDLDNEGDARRGRRLRQVISS